MRGANLMMWDSYTAESALVTDAEGNFDFEFEDNVAPHEIIAFMNRLILTDFDIDSCMELKNWYAPTDKIWILHDLTDGIDGITIVNWE